MVAEQERRRLGLGHSPILDISDLINSQNVWASGAKLPDDMSGLFLRHSSIGLGILVNFDPARGAQALLLCPRVRPRAARPPANLLSDIRSLIPHLRLILPSRPTIIYSRSFGTVCRWRRELAVAEFGGDRGPKSKLSSVRRRNAVLVDVDELSTPP
jgi:hypothetical protein